MTDYSTEETIKPTAIIKPRRPEFDEFNGISKFRDFRLGNTYNFPEIQALTWTKASPVIDPTRTP